MSSREHYQQTYYELGELAEGGNSTTYLAVSKRAVEEVRAQQGTKQQLEAMIRQKIVVIKVPRAGTGSLAQACDDLRMEIRVLTSRSTKGYHGIVEAIEHHDDEERDIVWLAMPYILGGAVGNIRTHHPQALSQKLIWHIMCQVLETLRYMAFGPRATSDIPSTDGWAPLSHGDMHDYNVLLKPRDSSTLPDTVMIDFGCSEPAVDEYGTYGPVLKDLTMLGDFLTDLIDYSKSPDLANYSDDTQLRRFVEDLWDPETSETNPDPSSEELKAVFDELISSASAARSNANLPDACLTDEMFDDVRFTVNVDGLLPN
ncbi:serine/threonine protein kinase [Teratosphaeria destructans]|uniref:Serine/threonine protein kinase n=1 Tax=Teratosphaeria destructans TaxID=418781 RepID=A0A9W7SJP4_9PEZI|nr:serine/threonine protein kinase [Teratosphaeria destructans]